MLRFTVGIFHDRMGKNLNERAFSKERFKLTKIIDVLKKFNPKNDYENSDDFISDGLIDSIDMQELFALLEDEYGVELAGTDLIPQNFASIEAIRDLLASHGVEGDI